MITLPVNQMQLLTQYDKTLKVFSVLVFILISSCNEYSEENDLYENKQTLPHKTAYYNSVPDWRMIDKNGNDINGKLNYFDREGKILKVEITVNSKQKQLGTVLMWYGGDSNVYDGETPLILQSESLIKMINLAKISEEYTIFPPQNNPAKAWSISYNPINLYDKSNSKSLLNKSLSINLYLEPKTTLTIIKRNVYIIDTKNSFIERKKITSYGIFGSISDVIKFKQTKTYRRIVIKAKSNIDNTDLNLDSGFVNVKTER